MDRARRVDELRWYVAEGDGTILVTATGQPAQATELRAVVDLLRRPSS